GDSESRWLHSIRLLVWEPLFVRKLLREKFYCLFVDLTDTFNTVWPTGVLYKLGSCEVREPILRWLHSYLTNRSFQVYFEGSYSSVRRAKSGVPQGDKFFICEIHWGAHPPFIKLCGGSMRPGIPPSIFNVPALCLPSPKPAPRPAKVEDQQLRYLLQKDKITSFDAFKPERDLQKQYRNLILSRSKGRLVCLFMTDNFSESSLSVIFENKPTLCSPLTLTHTSACVDTEKEIKLVFLTRQFELLSQKQFSMNVYCFAIQLYPKCNYEQLRDFLVLPCKRKLQYITPSIDKDQVLRETFGIVQTLLQKNVSLGRCSTDSSNCFIFFDDSTCVHF
ncbi:Reverse transcriptase domain, partial [Trinorchestia longiramus]